MKTDMNGRKLWFGGFAHHEGKTVKIVEFDEDGATRDVRVNDGESNYWVQANELKAE